MLKILRHKKTAKKIWIGLAVIIVPAFVFWGFGGATRSQKDANFAGRLFGRKVTFLEYNDSLDAVKNQAIMQFGDNLSEAKKYLNLEQQAWIRLTLLHEAAKRKIKASDKEVIEDIEANPYFQRNDRFDNRTYNETMRYVFRTQPRAYEEQTRQNIILSKLYAEVTADINLNDTDIAKEYQKQNEEISLYYIAALPADLGKIITVTEKEIQDYYDKNSFQFKEPLSFNIEYLSSDSKEKTDAAIRKTRAKTDFAKVAKDLGIQAKETGFFSITDPIPGIGWAPEITNLILKLKTGELAPPIHADKYYIIKLKERRESFIPEFAKIKDKVKEQLLKDLSKAKAQEKIEACLKEAQEIYKNNPKSVSFDKLAKAFGLHSDSTALFKFGSYIEGIGSSDKFWMAGVGLKDNQISPVLEMPTGFYIVKLKNAVPVDEAKFKQEKEEFGKKVLQQKKQEAFLKFTEDLKRKAQ